ncbi:Hypothetical protein FKW44_017207 [Caligus rogercresseyi]|uniref:Uncharacterized protein n=1 Tax=Caligus rogercresseyi TaxID=217165 RepID=A0A7T8H2X5_CALRO|nr:Hypothetical protein FKW44_017207 [Caligus rogercresseyi]
MGGKCPGGASPGAIVWVVIALESPSTSLHLAATLNVLIRQYKKYKNTKNERL